MADAGRILVLTTGGTIVSHFDQSGRKQYPGLSDSAAPLLAMAERLGWTVEVEAIASVGSQDMGRKVWAPLVSRVREACEEERHSGIVVTHGTDTLEETAFLLDLLVRANVPLVVTGAMLGAENPDSDGPANFAAALTVAADPEAAGYGVLVVMDEEIHTARHIFKRATQGTHAFASAGKTLAGRVRDGLVDIACTPHVLAGRFRLADPLLLPEVGVLACHADMSATLCRSILGAMPAALVVAGLGDGNIPAVIIGELADYAAKGGTVVRSSRVDGGFVPREAEVDDDAFGFVAANDLSPCKARLLLQCLLAEGIADPAGIQQVFDA